MSAPAPAAPSSPQKTLERPRSKAVAGRNCYHRLCIPLISFSDKLKAILEDTLDTDCQATGSKSSRPRTAIVSHGMLLAQQKLSMLKALEESSIQALILPSIVPAAIVDCDDDDDTANPLRSSAAPVDSASPDMINLKFLAKTKQQAGVLCVFCMTPLQTRA
jgi:hypothetical protein